MTRDEFKQIIKRIRTLYDSSEFIRDRDTFDLWYERLGKADYSLMVKAVNIYADNNKFTPKIADLKAIATDLYRADKKKLSAIRRYYDHIRSSYPCATFDGGNHAVIFEHLTVDKYPDDLDKALMAAVDIVNAAERKTKELDNGIAEYVPLERFLDEYSNNTQWREKG